MEKDIKPGNLQERSSPIKPELIKRGKRVIAREKALRSALGTSIETWESTAVSHNRDITSVMYRGDPFIYDFLNAQREMHNIIPTMRSLYGHGVITGTNPSVLEGNDLFEQKFKSLSFMDIENMEVDPKTHELAPQDIRRINKLFRTSGIFRIGREKNQAYVLEQLIYFASQQWTHPEISVPNSIKKFQANITAYFDYYTSFLTDFNRDPLNEATMLFMLALGSPYLPTAVSCYIPGKLNITPSSAIKLYKQRELLASDGLTRSSWRRLEKAFLYPLNLAYRNDAFPEDLAQFQHYSEEIDSTAAVNMQSYLQETATAQGQIQKKDEAQNLLEQWNKHKKAVIRDLMQDPKKRIEYQASQDHPAEKITMIRNRDTFVFIMNFSDDIHLTLEIDKTGKLFGVPPSLLKAYPHVSDAFIVDLLAPLLEKYKVKDTPISIEKNFIRQITVKPEVSEEFTQEDQQKEEDQISKPQKRKRRVQALTIFESDPLPPTTPPVSKAERFVAYSEDQIKELLGPQVSRQQYVVDHVLGSINNFQHGHANGVLLKGTSERIVHIRAGKYRIFLNRLGEGVYTLRSINHRREAYQFRA